MFHVKHEAWARDVDRLGVSLSAAQLDQLAAYEALLREMAVPRGMIAASEAARLWERHIADGLRGVAEIPDGASVADLGSGAGIPGVPLAVALPASEFVLIEPRRIRAAFLEAAVDNLGLSNVEIFPRRAEDIRRWFEVCVARAFSSPSGTWQAAQPLLAPEGVVVYWAGERFRPEALNEAGVRSRLSTHADLARTGPLVIMGPQ
jgi:16S rRNA (guanine527-N7)-methyltransferase